MTDPTVPSADAPPVAIGLAGGWALTLAPAIAHGVRRPLMEALAVEGPGHPVAVSAIALLVALAAVGAGGPRRIRGIAATSVAASGALGLAGPDLWVNLIALGAVALLVTVLLPWMQRQVPGPAQAMARRNPGLTTAAALMLAVGILQSARLSTFMGDAERTECQAIPVFDAFVHHSCLTAYVQGERLAERGVDNLYDEDWWPDLGHSATGAAEAIPYRPFSLDAFAYPPPFLLVPALLTRASATFAGQRALWYGLQTVMVLLGMWRIATWIGEQRPAAGVRILAFLPMVWVAPFSILIFQVGNVQAWVMVASVLAMMLLQRGQRAWGAAILAAAILAKISPALLGLTLLVQRRWWDAIATAAFGALWSLLTLAVVGAAPFVTFVQYELPRLQSGEALRFFTQSTLEIAVNVAPFGVPHKLQQLGFPFDDVWAADRQVGRVYALLTVVLTGLMALRRTDDRQVLVASWLAVLSLGALNSPYAPVYCLFTLLWLLAVWPVHARPWTHALTVVALFVGLHGLPGLSDRALLLQALAQQTAVFALLWGMTARLQPWRPGR